MASGSRHSLRYVRELVRGVTPATPAYKAFRQTETSLGLSKEKLTSAEARSDRMPSDIRHGARAVAGDVGIELSYGSYDDLLEATLMGTWGAGDGTGGSDRLKAGVVRRTFTIEREFADLETGEKYHRFTGCEFNKLELDVNANAMVTGTFSIIGKDMIAAATPVVGSTYANPLSTSPLDSFTGVLKEGGQTIAVITEIKLSIENGLESRYVVGDKTSINPSVGRAMVTGNITAFFEDSTLITKFINETTSSIEFSLPDPEGNVLTFVMPRIKYSGGQPDTNGDGPITLSMPIDALYDATSGTNLYIERKAAV